VVEKLVERVSFNDIECVHGVCIEVFLTIRLTLASLLDLKGGNIALSEAQPHEKKKLQKYQKELKFFFQRS